VTRDRRIKVSAKITKIKTKTEIEQNTKVEIVTKSVKARNVRL
jgi:hypothetical protein